MEMKEYLLEGFGFNDRANRKMIKKLAGLPQPGEGIRYMSHLINSQYRWMARVTQSPDAQQMSWWDPLYAYDRLEAEWLASLQPWLDLIGKKSESQLAEEISFVGFDGARWSALFLDIAIQLIYHSVHHRAQIQVIFRSQGLEPDFIDYIGTKYRRTEP